MLTKLLLLNVAKLGIVGSLGVLLLAEVGALGLPGGWVLISLLVNVFGFGWACHGFLGSLVGGMVKPDRDSSKAYIQFYNSTHLFFHRSASSKELLEMMAQIEKLIEQNERLSACEPALVATR